MSSEKKTIESVFANVQRIVMSGAISLDALINFKKSGGVFEEVVDGYVPGSFARVLTRQQILDAFKKGDAYVVRQAHRAFDWYHRSNTSRKTSQMPYHL